MGTAGRPQGADQLTPEAHEKIVAWVAAGDYIEGAAAKCDIAKVAVYAWLKKGARSKTGKHRDFLNAVNRAQEESEKKFLDVIDTAAFGFETTEVTIEVDRDGVAVGNSKIKKTRRIDWKAAAWRLKHKRPARYALRGDDAVLTRDALDEFIAQLLQVIEEEYGETSAKKILEKIREQLPDDDGADYFARSRLQISYQDENGTNGKSGSTEVLADPYLPALPASQQDLAGEIPGLGVRPPVGENPLGSGEGGAEMPNP